METLADREDEEWRQVQMQLIQSQPKAYESATTQLVKLKELAEFKGTQTAFKQKMDSLQQKYKNRHSLLSRWRRAGLVV